MGAVERGNPVKLKGPYYCEQQVFKKYEQLNVKRLQQSFDAAAVPHDVQLHTFFLYQGDDEPGLQEVLTRLQETKFLSANTKDIATVSEEVAWKLTKQVDPNTKFMRNSALIWSKASDLKIKAVLQVGGGLQTAYEYMYYSRTYTASQTHCTPILWHSASLPDASNERTWKTWKIQRIAQLQDGPFLWHETPR